MKHLSEIQLNIRADLKLEYVADLHMHLHQFRLDNLKDLSVWWQKGSIINQTFTLIQYSHKVNLTVLHTSNIWIYSLLLPLHLIVCLRSVRQDVFWNVYLTFIFVLPWAVYYVGQLSSCKFHWQAVATWTSICPEIKFCLSSLDICMRSCWLKFFWDSFHKYLPRPSRVLTSLYWKPT